MRDHSLRNCVNCNRRCSAWLCGACSYASGYNRVRFQCDAPSSTPTSVSRQIQLRLGNDIAFDQVACIRSVPDYQGGSEMDARTRLLRYLYSDVRFTANERRRIRGMFFIGETTRPQRRSWNRRWSAFAEVWPRIGLACLVAMVNPEQNPERPERRRFLPRAVIEMP